MKNCEKFEEVFGIPLTLAMLHGSDFWFREEFNRDMDNVSDGFHTFKQLYHQRAMLFATIINLFPDISFKTLKHEDGHYCFDKEQEWFLVGIHTPAGDYTYHFRTADYWYLFKCPEIEKAPHFDGHTEKDVDRLFSLLLLDKIKEKQENENED